MSQLHSLLDGKPRYILILLILIGVGAAFWLGVERLKVDTDITSALPGNDPVVDAARRILRHHPVLENVFIQIGAPEGPVDQRPYSKPEISSPALWPKAASSRSCPEKKARGPSPP